jgi:hypothetical protein
MKIEEMRYQIDKDLDELREIVARCAEHCGPKNHDSERAHVAEDELMARALELIAKHAMRPRVKELAEIGLSTRDFGFSRWCA